MEHYVRQILSDQYEASLAMLRRGIVQCPAGHWESTITRLSVRQVIYHALFFTDLYLSSEEDAFELREIHRRGGDEREPGLAPGLPQDETLLYADICRQKAVAAVAAETPVTLQRPSGFSWLPISRGELHVYNIRHIQHHAGQVSASLGRVGDGIRWVKTGWPDA